jgi:hypothetical protein
MARQSDVISAAFVGGFFAAAIVNVIDLELGILITKN